jgi:hypothetical protein
MDGDEDDDERHDDEWRVEGGLASLDGRAFAGRARI